MCQLHTMGYCSALNKKEILVFMATQMNQEDIALSRISQSQRTSTARRHLPVGADKVKPVGTEESERWLLGPGQRGVLGRG